MRGSPILRALIVFLALLSLAPVLWRLTRADARAVRQPVPQPVAAKAKSEVRLTFSTAAKRVELQHLGKPVWSKAAPSAEESFTFETPWPKEGIELHVLVEWPEGTHSGAMRVRLTAPDGTEHDRSVWGDSTADDVLTFQ